MPLATGTLANMGEGSWPYATPKSVIERMHAVEAWLGFSRASLVTRKIPRVGICVAARRGVPVRRLGSASRFALTRSDVRSVSQGHGGRTRDTRSPNTLFTRTCPLVGGTAVTMQRPVQKSAHSTARCPIVGSGTFENIQSTWSHLDR